MDHQVRAVVTLALRDRGVDVLTAADDGTERLSDPNLLSKASSLGRVLFTQDDDFLAEAARRQHLGEPFAGIIYMKQQRLTDRQVVDELEVVAGCSDASEWANRIDFLPLK